MKLIADSGGTSTTWIYSSDINNPIETIGMNPYIVSADTMIEEIEKSGLKDIANEVTEIYFYGAGCTHKPQIDKVKNVLKTIFTNAKIVEVYSDVLGACRALFGYEDGIACILGTGTNAALYRNKEIEKSIAGLGYVLGDYGSGTDIGKHILSDYLYEVVPPEIHNYLKKERGLGSEEILDKVYNQPFSNKYIGSFSQVASKFIDTDYVQNLLEVLFTRFIDYHIVPLDKDKNLKVGAVGSVASNFQKELEKTMKKQNITLSKVVQNPIQELVKFHIK